MKRLLSVLALCAILPACSTAWLTPDQEWGPGLMHWGKTTTTGYPDWSVAAAPQTQNPITADAQDSQDESFKSEGTSEDRTATSDENNNNQEDQGVMAQDTGENQNTLTEGAGEQQEQDQQSAQADQQNQAQQADQSEQTAQSNQDQQNQAEANQSNEENQAEQSEQDQDTQQTDENVMGTEGNADNGKTDTSTGTIGR
jgi:hypothetical protein